MRWIAIAAVLFTLPIAVWSADPADDFRKARAAVVQSGADRIAPAFSLARADELAKQANTIAATRPAEAARLYRDALWQLPKLPTGLPPEVVRILGLPTLRHAGSIESIAIDPATDRLISGSSDRGVCVWSLRDGSLVFAYRGHTEPVSSVAVLPNGVIASAAGKEIHVWSPGDTKPAKILTGSTGNIKSIAHRPGSKNLVSGGEDRAVRLWDLDKPGESKILSVQNGSVTCVSCTESLLAVGNQEGVVTVWDLGSKDHRKVLEHRAYVSSPVQALQLAANGKSLAVCGGRFSKFIALPNPHEHNELPGSIRRTFEGHTEEVDCLAISPNGKWLATGGKDHRVRLWDVATGQVLRTFRDDTDEDINSLAFTGDGLRLAVASNGQSIRIWNLDPIVPESVWAGHRGPVWSVATSPDGRFVATGGADRAIRIWDRLTNKELRNLAGHDGPITALGFSMDGRSIVSTSGDKTIRLWDVESGQSRVLNGHEGPVLALAISPVGRRIATGGVDRTVRIWDLDQQKQLAQWTIPSATVAALSFHPDGGKVIAASADGMVRILDLSTSTTTTPIAFKAHPIGGTSAVAFLPGGKMLATCGGDQLVKVWDIQAIAKEPAYALSGHAGPVSTLAVSPDGKFITSGGADATVKLWDVATRAEVQTFRGHNDWVSSVAFTSDGANLFSASVDGQTCVWRMSRANDSPPVVVHQKGISALVSLPGGDLLSASLDRQLIRWNVQSGRPTKIMINRGGTLSVAVSADGKRILSAGRDKKVRLFDSTTGEEVRVFEPQDRVPTLCFAPGERHFLAWQFRKETEDDVTSLIQRFDILTGRTEEVVSEKTPTTHCLSFSNDGTMAVVGTTDGKLRIWQLDRKNRLADDFPAHAGPITDVVFTPDKSLIVSCSRDGDIKVWRVVAAPGTPVTVVKAETANLLGLAMSPDGSRFAAFSSNAVVIHEPQTGRLIKKIAMQPITAASFVAGSRQLAIGLGDGTIDILDVP